MVVHAAKEAQDQRGKDKLPHQVSFMTVFSTLQFLQVQLSQMPEELNLEIKLTAI